MTPQPSQKYLRECFDYDPDTGLLTWRERPRSHFATPYQHALWASRWAGRPAFRELDRDGYCGGRLDGRRRKAHRIIWKWLHGSEPIQVDHIDRNRSNNRANNLRSVTHLENMKNRNRQANNTTGCTGIVRHRDRWSARIKVEGRVHYLGVFDDLEDAKAARREAELRFGFVTIREAA